MRAFLTTVLVCCPVVAWGQETPAAPVAPAPAPVVPAAPAPVAPRPDPKCLPLRVATPREVEKTMEALQDEGYDRFLTVEGRMLCGWKAS